MRKLASIQKILRTESIKGADAIEKAFVLGWQLVIRKEEFKKGDLCVYIEIDSVLPDRSEFKFMRARSNRIKTVRLRGQISQGICFPLSILPVGWKITEGLDVTDVLAIKKYEPAIPANLAGEMKGNFPSFMPKTDETRIQILQTILDQYKGLKCYVAEKLDGSSATFYLRDGVFGVCTRNLELKYNEENSLWRFAQATKLEEKMRSLKRNISLQGEIIGEGIQKNKYKVKGQTVYFFNAFDIDKYEYLSLHELRNLMSILGLNMVPVLEETYLLESSMEVLVEKSKLKSVLNKDTIAEGIVIRPVTEMIEKYTLQGRLSFKVINPDFLIRYDE